MVLIQMPKPLKESIKIDLPRGAPAIAAGVEQPEGALLGRVPPPRVEGGREARGLGGGHGSGRRVVFVQARFVPFQGWVCGEEGARGAA